ncbi:MAG: AEC family transporter [Verrucomicrobiae bacterium]|nr:AEC family transporter [Verrucomicrobiae bacterium]
MNSWFTVLTAVLPVFGIMGIGLWLRRRNWLSADADQSLMRLTINLLLPSLIFDSVLGNPALRQPANLLLPPLLGFGMVVVGIGVARLFAPLTGLTSPPEQRTFAFLTGLQNYAYLTIPLCITLFDPGTTGVLFVHNVGTEMAMWTLGVAVVSGGGFSGGWKRFVNAPLAALLLALMLNFIGLHFTPPPLFLFFGTTVLTMVHWLGQSAIPLALLLIGAVVADHLSAARGGRAPRVVAVAALVRLVLLPVIFLLLARFLPCSIELKRVLVLQGAMPSAVLPIVLARHYGGDARTALQVALGTSLLGLVTIPLWIRFGEYFANLLPVT